MLQKGDGSDITSDRPTFCLYTYWAMLAARQPYLNYSAEIAPVGHCAAQAPQSTQASALIS